MPKIIRTSTVPQSLNVFCRGLFMSLKEEGYEVVAVSSPGRDLDEISEREGVRAWPVKMERHFSPFRDILGLFKLIKVFRAEKPDMVHSITPKAGLLSMMAGWITGVPVRLHTFTGLVFPTSKGVKKLILKTTDRLTCHFATHIIAEGRGVRNDLLNNDITSKQLTILGYGSLCGVNHEYFNPELEYVKKEATKIKNENSFTFIFIGRLVKDKGVKELVEAFCKLNSEYPNSRLILLGEEETGLDPLDTTTKQKIETNHSIEKPGFIKDIRPWLAASNVLVLPSYREGFPNVVLEAGAMGKPSLVTDINGSNEIIVDGYNGKIVPPHNPNVLYEEMNNFINGKYDLHSMGVNALRNVRTRFTKNMVETNLKEYYQKIIE